MPGTARAMEAVIRQVLWGSMNSGIAMDEADDHRRPPYLWLDLLHTTA